MTQQFNKEQLARTICAGATDDEVELFIEQCQRTGLDPYSRQIIFMMRKAKLANGNYGAKATTLISIDGARLVAYRTGHYDGSDTYWCADDGVWLDVWLTRGVHPAAAKTTVKRGTATFTGVAVWHEYGEGASGPMWSKMGAHMLAKCSEMQALRRGFPAELSGLYSTDEMPAEKTSSRFVGDGTEISLITLPAPGAAEAEPFEEPVSRWTVEQMGAWATKTFPHRFRTVEEVKTALRERGVRSWGPRLDKQGIQSMLTLIASHSSAQSIEGVQPGTNGHLEETGTGGGDLLAEGT